MKRLFTKAYQKAWGQFLWSDIAFATLSLVPLLICAWLFRDLLFLKVGLITISLFIAANRLNYGFTMISLHYALILLGFTLLYFSIHHMHWLFVLLSALIALGCILLTCVGDKLRTLGNYIFIPSLYLACEIQYAVPHPVWLSTYWHFVLMTPIAWLTVVVMQVFFKAHWSSLPAKAPALDRQIHFWCFNIPDKGKPLTDWLPSALAIFMGVMTAALITVIFQLESPEWLIWSTASVITTELVLTRLKVYHRFSGALIGIAIGLVVSLLLPHTPLAYSLSVLGIMLTLVSFKSYPLSFSSRCFFITLAAYAISGSEHLALIRIQNVFIGGLIGLSAFYLSHQLLKFAAQKHCPTLRKP